MCAIAAAIGIASAFGGSAVAGAVAGAVGVGSFFASAVGSAIVGAVAGGVIGAGLSLVTGQDPLMGALGGALGGGLAAYSGGFGFDTGQSLTAGADAATAGSGGGLSGGLGPDVAPLARNPIASSAGASTQGAKVIGSATQGVQATVSNPLPNVAPLANSAGTGASQLPSQGFFGKAIDGFNSLSDPMQEGILKAGTEGLKGAFTPDATEAARAKAEAEASGLMARDAANATRDYGNVTEALKQFGTPQSAQITDTGNFGVTIDPKTGQYVYLGRRPNRGFGGAAQAGQPAFATGVA
jgi:hypothetical protein